MPKLIVIGFFLVNLMTYALARDADGCRDIARKAISRTAVSEMIEANRRLPAETKRVRQAVQSAGLRAVILNADVVNAHNNSYTNTVEQGLITDQAASGRCWIFAGTNILRSHLLYEKRVPADFEFSESYLHLFHYFEQSNRQIEKIIDLRNSSRNGRVRRSELSPDIFDGGWFEYFSFLVNKYGLVPKSAMPDTLSAKGTTRLVDELKMKLGEITAELEEKIDLIRAEDPRSKFPGEKVIELRKIKDRGLRAIFKILTTHLGVPPTEFEWRRPVVEEEKKEPKSKEPKVPKNLKQTEFTLKKFTPREFASDFVRFNSDDYVTVVHNPVHPFGKVYEFMDSSIGIGSTETPEVNLKLYNLPMPRLIELITQSIDAGEPLWFASDVIKDMDGTTGIMHPEIFNRDGLHTFAEDETFRPLNREQQVRYYLTMATHAMAITAYDRPVKDGPVLKMRVENSWGASIGEKGQFHMYREWFEKYGFIIIVPKAILSDAEIQTVEAPSKKLRLSSWFF